jgi:hypothetical protein
MGPRTGRYQARNHRWRSYQRRSSALTRGPAHFDWRLAGATLVRNLLGGQYENPVRIVAFNIAEGWSRDVTLDIADELRRRCVEYDEVPASVLRFLETASRH